MRISRFFGIGFILCTCGGTLNATDLVYEVIAVSGQLAPGTQDAEFSSFFNPIPAMDSQGRVWFGAQLQGPTISGDTSHGYWLGGNQPLTKLVQKGDPAPGPVGTTYTSLHSILGFHESGQGVINGSSAYGFRNYDAIWAGTPGELQLIAISNDPAPGTDGFYFTDIEPARVSRNGDIVFAGTIRRDAENTTYGSGIWRHRNGVLNPVAIEDREVVSPSGLIRLLNFSPPRVNDAGDVAFRAFVRNADTGYNGVGVFIEDGQNVREVFRDRARADDGYLLTNPSVLRHGSSGRVLLSTQDLSSHFLRIVSLHEGQFRTLLKHGGPTPLEGRRYLLERLPFSGGLDSEGQYTVVRTGYTDDTAGTSGSGIWLDDSHTMKAVATTEDIAPGTGGGVFSSFSSVYVNDVGQVVFRARAYNESLTGYDPETGTFLSPYIDGVWSYGLDGELDLVVRSGQLFNVSNDPTITDLRTIQEIYLQSVPNTRPSQADGVHAHGPIPLQLAFADGSYAVVVATVPEPSTLPVILLAGSVTAVIGRRRAASRNLR
ncbi:MAG: choice-of-anchor tandem repeat NxxGxxAF-containing protein [Planctomycetota bacterium]